MSSVVCLALLSYILVYSLTFFQVCSVVAKPMSSNRNTRDFEGAICCFHVNQNFVLRDFVFTRFHCSCEDTIFSQATMGMPNTNVYVPIQKHTSVMNSHVSHSAGVPSNICLVANI